MAYIIEGLRGFVLSEEERMRKFLSQFKFRPVGRPKKYDDRAVIIEGYKVFYEYHL